MTDDLNNLTPQELGNLFPIIIADYDPDWGKLFLHEKQNILKAVDNNNIRRIEHIGSTAIPGLCAKPTIDILIEISDKTNCDFLIKSLQKIQYQYIPKHDNPPPHIMLAKGYSKTGLIGQTFHIHVRYAGDWDEIIFRDYLIRHPETAKQYCNLKKQLSIMFKNDREKYTDSKTDFIKLTTQLARNIRH
jgi:GrpB-like predicted nucleotidyltransferase (UPF0157 family)